MSAYQITSSGFLIELLYEFIISIVRAICPAHLILLYWITLTTYGKVYELLSPSLCNFNQSHISFCFLDPNVLVSLSLEYYSFLGCRAVHSHVSSPTFQTCVLPPSSP
jgi:hypothetical protein